MRLIQAAHKPAFAPSDWLGYVQPYAVGEIANFWLIERLFAF
jgi:hypothetical protein